MMAKLYKALIVVGFLTLLSGCTTFNIKEISIDLESDNYESVEIDFSQYSTAIEWDTLYIVRPYSNVKEFQFENWNLNQLDMMAQSDSEILVLYSLKKRVVGYSLVPRRFDLLQLWGETKYQYDPYIKFDLKRSKFLFVKRDEVYKLVDIQTDLAN